MNGNFLKLVDRHGAELRRALAAHRYERMDNGDILVPGMKLVVGGRFSHSLNGGDWVVDDNRVVNEGLNHLLNVVLGNAAQTATWYVALFSGNVTPPASWTGANFVANATEFTAYTAANRIEYADAPATSQQMSNTANPAEFIVNGVGGTAYGAALLSNPAKGSTTGPLFSAARFAAERALVATDILRVTYEVGASST